MSWLTSWWRSSPSPSQPVASQTDSSPAEQRPVPPVSFPPATANPNRNKLLFLGGATFFAFSLVVTRRAFARRLQRLPNASHFYTNAPAHTAEANSNTSGAREALEALHLATINVLSFAMMATGGTLWYLDINSLADARKMIRGGLGVDGTGRNEKEAEEDFEEWMATTLARKEHKVAAKEGDTERRR
ncbi:hypothetical protein DV736_g2506, partial [Chaetothyriales sp. CBS 134916]